MLDYRPTTRPLLARAFSEVDIKLSNGRGREIFAAKWTAGRVIYLVKTVCAANMTYGVISEVSTSWYR